MCDYCIEFMLLEKGEFEMLSLEVIFYELIFYIGFCSMIVNLYFFYYS
jgi:hypothetical protein